MQYVPFIRVRGSHLRNLAFLTCISFRKSCLLHTTRFHIACGLAALALVGLQFHNRWFLQSYRHIDFRLVNVVHLYTGITGLYVTAARRGSVAAKFMYIISLAVALLTAGFYADTAYLVSSEKSADKALLLSYSTTSSTRA